MKLFAFTIFSILLLQSCTKNDSPSPDPNPPAPTVPDTLTASWQLKKIDSAGRSFTDMTFLDASTGFVCGESNSLFKTTDGGTTWQPVSVAGVFGAFFSTNIQFISSRYGFIASSAGVLRTTDGGNTWNLVSTSNFIPTDVFFLNPGTGFSTSGSDLRKTIDSGKTWIGVSTIFSACSSLWFVNDTKGFVTTSKGLYKTVDGGTTFSQVVNNGNSSYIPIYFATPTNGAAGLGIALYITNDGGATWSVAKYFSNSIIDVKNVDANEYYVSTQTEIWHGTNGGNTWVREVKLGGDKKAVEFTLGQPGHVWISATNGYVLYK